MQLDRHHILLYIGIFILALLGVYGIMARVADKATARAEKAEAKAELITEQNKEFQAQITQQVQQLVLQNQQLAAQNQQLEADRARLNQALLDQKTKDSHLPPDQLAARIVSLAPGGSIKVQTDGYLVDQPEAIAIAQTLEEVPVLKANVSNLEQENANLTTEVANDGKALDLEKQSHAGDVSALNATIMANKAQLAAVKAQCRKSKLKWFGAGVVIGFIGRHFAGF